MSDIRNRIVAEACKVQDYRAGDPATVDAFRDLLGPPPKGAQWDLSKPFRAWQVDGKWRTEGVSTCGLVAAGILRRAGGQLPWLGCDYWHFGGPFEGLDIVSALTRLGQVERAVRSAGSRPEPGDVCCIGRGLRTHVRTCVEDDGTTITSVDGGQVDDGTWLQRCRVVRRVWSKQDVIWVLDAVQLFAAMEAAVVYP
jgi:hypothetical protein